VHEWSERPRRSVEEAIVDAYGEEEQLTGLYTMIGDVSRCRSRQSAGVT